MLGCDDGAPRDRGTPTPGDGPATTGATPIADLPPDTVRLSEIVAYQGIGPDFIEIVNTGETDVAMAGAGLWSDDRNDQDPWTFPEGVVIGPGEHLVVVCTGTASAGPLEASFELAREGGDILFATTGPFVERVQYPPMNVGHAYAQIAVDDTLAWLLIEGPTPGRANGWAVRPTVRGTGTLVSGGDAGPDEVVVEATDSPEAGYDASTGVERRALFEFPPTEARVLTLRLESNNPAGQVRLEEAFDAADGVLTAADFDRASASWPGALTWEASVALGASQDARALRVQPDTRSQTYEVTVVEALLVHVEPALE